VTPETRRKVKDAMEQLNYAPDKQARGLAFKRSFLLGLVFDNPNALYVSDIQKGILSVCRQAGFELIMHRSTLGDPGLGSEISQFVAGAQVDGVIFMSPISQLEELAKRMKRDQVPYVRISPKKNDALARVVVSNDMRGAELMTEHLISLGHRHIGFITGPEKNLSAQQKLEGFRRSMSRHGLPTRKSSIREGDNTFDSGVREGQALLLRKNRPTAIFASNDEMALGVMKTAALQGISVPEQVSIAGFDDSALASMVWPDLTTIRLPLERIGAFAAKRLFEQLNGQKANKNRFVEFEPQLVVRGSTRRLYQR
jgi:LacI family transcriptional regulator